MKVVGILSLSNATELGYPYWRVIRSMFPLCDTILIGVDPNFPKDEDIISCKTIHITPETPDLVIIRSEWDQTNRSKGSEISRQMQELVDHPIAKSADWLLVLQADELVHEQDTELLRNLMLTASPSVVGFSMERLYFWKNKETIRRDWTHRLVRLFRPGTHTFVGGDGMFSEKLPSCYWGEVEWVSPCIYHYSRMGDPKKISQRIRNLDTFFHEEETLIEEENLPEYDFKMRQFDNFSKNEIVPSVKGVLEVFKGSHPLAIQGYF